MLSIKTTIQPKKDLKEVWNKEQSVSIDVDNPAGPTMASSGLLTPRFSVNDIVRTSGGYRRRVSNMGFYWAFMERAVQEKLKVFNFGRCTPGAGTHRFKKQWGGRDVPLFWYGTGGTTPVPEGGALSLGPRVWRHLPLAVANRLGPLIVRGIP